jgi:hypothetical protein
MKNSNLQFKIQNDDFVGNFEFLISKSKEETDTPFQSPLLNSAVIIVLSIVIRQVQTIYFSSNMRLVWVWSPICRR